jgi:hypothetical protein
MFVKGCSLGRKMLSRYTGGPFIDLEEIGPRADEQWMKSGSRAHEECVTDEAIDAYPCRNDGATVN